MGYVIVAILGGLIGYCVAELFSFFGFLSSIDESMDEYFDGWEGK